LSCARAKAESFGIDPRRFDEQEFHLHVPQGAIPKDGPSAGITMATALVSLLTRTPVKRNVAMTGEITLRGRVLPIGGLREKVLAAVRAGIEEVIVPAANEPDLVEVPEALRRKVKVHIARDIEDVLNVALAVPPRAAERVRPAAEAEKPAPGAEVAPVGLA
jgi:ATP-dependent Lon protease